MIPFSTQDLHHCQIRLSKGSIITRGTNYVITYNILLTLTLSDLLNCLYNVIEKNSNYLLYLITCYAEGVRVQLKKVKDGREKN